MTKGLSIELTTGEIYKYLTKSLIERNRRFYGHSSIASETLLVRATLTQMLLIEMKMRMLGITLSAIKL